MGFTDDVFYSWGRQVRHSDNHRLAGAFFFLFSVRYGDVFAPRCAIRDDIAEGNPVVSLIQPFF